jgi:hypothetical protein
LPDSIPTESRERFSLKLVSIRDFKEQYLKEGMKEAAKDKMRRWESHHTSDRATDGEV